MADESAVRGLLGGVRPSAESRGPPRKLVDTQCRSAMGAENNHTWKPNGRASSSATLPVQPTGRSLPGRSDPQVPGARCRPEAELGPAFRTSLPPTAGAANQEYYPDDDGDHDEKYEQPHEYSARTAVPSVHHVVPSVHHLTAFLVACVRVLDAFPQPTSVKPAARE